MAGLLDFLSQGGGWHEREAARQDNGSGIQPTAGYQALMAMLAPYAESAARNVQGFVHDDPQVKSEWRKWNADTPLEDKVRQVGPFIPGVGEGVMMTNAAMDYADGQNDPLNKPQSMRGINSLFGMLAGGAIGARRLYADRGANKLGDYLMGLGLAPVVGATWGGLADVATTNNPKEDTIRREPVPRMSMHKYGGQR